MYVTFRRTKRGQRVYEYVDIVESYRIQGKVRRKTLGTLGRRDELPAQKIDGLIEHLRKLASPEGRRGVRLGEMRIRASRELGVSLAARQLWQELGLDQLLANLPQSKSAPVAEAVFRMVVNRLSDPLSKLALVDWQGQVEWPSGKGDLDHNQYLRAMDRLHPHRQQIEDAVFARVTELFSLPLSLVFYDLTSVYFEGDGVSPLAEYGYSRDHRDDRSQVVVGLAVTQEGLPITHRVYPGNTGDPLTFLPMVRELKERFGLPDAVIVADRGLFSAANVEGLEASGVKYVLALRARQQLEGPPPSSWPTGPGCRDRRTRTRPGSCARSASARASGMWSSTPPTRRFTTAWSGPAGWNEPAPICASFRRGRPSSSGEP